MKFDKIFFTGSTKVGKIVYKAAAEHLTPVVLELGGKSPAIVSKEAHLETAAKRIVWGKFLNAGQTCVAPDYLLVEESIQEQFLEMLRKYIKEFNYSPDSVQYTRIINKKNFHRLTDLIDREKVYFGGSYDEEKLYIEPTILNHIHWEDPVMEEEIFGPILPVISFKNFTIAINTVSEQENRLPPIYSPKIQKKKKYSPENFLLEEAVSMIVSCI